ncbi:MAG: amidophosphoribosyltransferase [Pirellulales bacterium]|nr:amidophosphoribosyltransferase [Pirellulales bacterium]
MSELHHECGIVAVYHLPGGETSPLCPAQGPEEISRLIPRMLLDIQNRGQLSAGMSTYNPQRRQLIAHYKDLGNVSEVFRMNHRPKFESLMERFAGRAAIGHVRYATCGAEDLSYAQPFERHHLQKQKWFSFAFNGQLANYGQLKSQLLANGDNFLARDTDTEIILHAIGHQYVGDRRPSLVDVCKELSSQFDGAYCLVLINAVGEMLVMRDPLGLRPLCYAKEGSLFAAASESVALLNLGFAAESIHSLRPGQCITISDGRFAVEQYCASPRRAHCFFEWIYFANVASTMDGRGVYLSRKALGEELADLEDVQIDDDTIVVPVPDTSKAAADAMAYRLKVPSLEGLIRNRYTGRTFIEGSSSRTSKAQLKYTPLREVLEGKRVLLVEDSIVRSTTMKVLIDRIRSLGRAREIHVRVACPPIVAPCFYGIDMSRISELFAPQFLPDGKLTAEAQVRMARQLGADSLRYLPVESIARAIGFDSDQLCQACITGNYPTPCGQELYSLAQAQSTTTGAARTYEIDPAEAPGGGAWAPEMVDADLADDGVAQQVDPSNW